MLKVYFLDDKIQNNLQASSFYIIAPYQKVGGVSFAEFCDIISCCPVLNAVCDTLVTQVCYVMLYK